MEIIVFGNLIVHRQATFMKEFIASQLLLLVPNTADGFR